MRQRDVFATSRQPESADSALRVSCTHRFPQGFSLDVEFAASSGVTALFGPSGCGKTTTLELIAGLRRPAAGCIRICDRVFYDSVGGVNLPPERRRVGYVPQDDLLFPHFNVRQNLQFGMARSSRVAASSLTEGGSPASPLAKGGLRGVRKTPLFDVEDIASLLELSELLERRPATLSGGERQRVALGRAVIRGPEILLMDEPVSATDESLKQGLLQALRRIVGQLRLIAVFVSHDQADVRQFAERVVLMDNGRVVAAGPTVATLDEAFRGGASAAFPTNVVSVSSIRPLDGTMHGEIGKNVAVLPTTLAAIHDATVLASFRPSDVMLARREVEGLSVRNAWRGRVSHIVAAVDRIFVQVNVGQMIWAEITTEAVHALNLRVGDEVVCLVKTSAMHVTPS